MGKKPTEAQLRLIDARDAALRGGGFEESSCTHRTLRLLGSRTTYNGVFARRALGVGNARVGPSTDIGCRCLKEPRSAYFTISLGAGSPSCLCILARLTINMGGTPFQRTTFCS